MAREKLSSASYIPEDDVGPKQPQVQLNVSVGKSQPSPTSAPATPKSPAPSTPVTPQVTVLKRPPVECELCKALKRDNCNHPLSSCFVYPKSKNFRPADHEKRLAYLKRNNLSIPPLLLDYPGPPSTPASSTPSTPKVVGTQAHFEDVGELETLLRKLGLPEESVSTLGHMRKAQNSDTESQNMILDLGTATDLPDASICDIEPDLVTSSG